MPVRRAIATLVATTLAATLLPATVAAAPASAATATPKKVISSKATAKVETYAYGGSSKQEVDAHYDSTKTGKPWVVVFHGGSLVHGDKSSMTGIAGIFKGAGYTVFNANYRLGIDVPWPAQSTDALNVTAWVKAHASQFGINPNRGAAYGFSSGGQLAAKVGTVGTGSARVKAVITTGAAADPYKTWLTAHTTDPAKTNGIGQSEGYRQLGGWTAIALRCPPIPSDAACWSRWRDATPANNASSTDAKFWLVTGTRDWTVPYTNSVTLDSKLRSVGAKSTLVKVTGGTHTQDVLWADAARKKAALAFLAAATK